jgi:hypothetical protein
MDLSQEVKMLRNITPESCRNLNAQKYFINNNIPEINSGMVIALEILPTTCYSGFGVVIVLKSETFQKNYF